MFLAFVDYENPVITNCPEDLYQKPDSGTATAEVTWTPPTAGDNSKVQTLSSDHDPGDTFGVGSHEVIYTSEDESGNTATCTFNVIIGMLFGSYPF